jgi:hypothetical protein
LVVYAGVAGRSSHCRSRADKGGSEGPATALGLLAAPAFRRSGATAERTTPLGERTPDVPEMRRPPEEGGLH